MRRDTFEKAVAEVASGSLGLADFPSALGEPFEPMIEAWRRVFGLAAAALSAKRTSRLTGAHEGYEITYNEWSDSEQFEVRLPDGDPFSEEDGSRPKLGAYKSLEAAKAAIERHRAKARKFEPFEAIVAKRGSSPRLVKVTSLDENGRDVYTSPVEKPKPGSCGNGRSKERVEDIYPASEANLAMLRRYDDMQAEVSRLAKASKEIASTAEPYALSPFGGGE